MKILDWQNWQMIDINNKISENKPMEIEIVFDDGHIVVWTIFMKHYNDLCLRVDSSKFVNLVNVNAFWKLDENDEKKMGKMIPCTMLCNTKRIFTVKEINKLYKTVKVWVIDNDSKIKWKKKQIEKIVPLDYIEEDITEINNVISNSMIWNFQMPR
jgi:GTPase SAR1 family protein